ncbi:MAG: PQQ-binding-like beta-propeller repeat protein [bacterium]|nr:PQQ-binding-like beta-propeller repeat protein [bacterium]
MKQLRRLKKTIVAGLSAVMLLNVPMETAYVGAAGNNMVTISQAVTEQKDWSSFRGNEKNNGITDAAIPYSYQDASLYWATEFKQGWTTSGCPILVGDYLYFTFKKNIVKVNKFTGKQVLSMPMEEDAGYAINTPAYANGKIFVTLSDGIVQAFDGDTLESVWIYRDKLEGTPNANIICHGDYLYTGFYNSKTDANFVCINTKDEDPESKTEEKDATWTYALKNGFYWSGACVAEDYLVVGGENGTVVTLDLKTGNVLDSITDISGNIRCNISYDTATKRYYFTSSSGYFYSMEIGENGKIDKAQVKSIKLSGASTSTPVVYNGRAYVGVSGTNAYKAYTGHNITVIDLDSFTIAYTCETRGYSQSSGLLTTAYEKADGSVYVYFLENYESGIVRVIKDKKGQTTCSSGTYADILFTPQDKQKNYALCSAITDEYGTLYFKNDSGYMMAVGSAIDTIEVKSQPAKTTYNQGEIFDPTGLKVVATYKNGMERDITSEVSFSKEAIVFEGAEGTDSCKQTIQLLCNQGLYQDILDTEKEDNHLSKKLESIVKTVEITVNKDEAVTFINKVKQLPTVTKDNLKQAITSLNGLLKEYNELSPEHQAKVNADPALAAYKKQVAVQLLQTKTNKSVVEGSTILLLQASEIGFENEIQITSSNSKVVSITNKQTAKAVAPGKATIKVTLNGTVQVASFDITVTKKAVVTPAKPAAPTVKAPGATKITKVESKSATSIRITYSKRKDADGYFIYRSEKKNSSYKKIKTITNKKTVSYTDSYKIKTGTKYYYKVVAYKKSGTKTVNAKASNIKSGKAILSTTKITKAKASSRSKVSLTWKKVSYASGYEIYQATKKNGTYKKVATINKGKTTNKTITKLKKNKAYYYKVRAYRVVNKKKVYSNFSGIKSVKTKK